MAQDSDDKFYDRADAYIQLANTQFEDAELAEVSASFMYAFARYTAWLSSQEFSSGKDMQAAKAKTMAFFTKQFQAMLEENFDDYIENFETYQE
ncbi:DUF3144 domain-containing protein [Chitinimonas sp. BJB300]|uniref:DUF3144 domain-containing protein n=1 Tax=Chitinimonas sp. BJB300 TaxID=1559339 RepID=UPI000C0E5575|nr:DUF3144 domain-containing protein [Chitinimonas sp. BJB300]PHV12313.1 hypothetical protein CSQ89_06485 [Chitinimonas sp. BJB300]TSJ88161.1 DUF3144 domain-containing protein [Chitinimonas sp. BJB300]